MALLLRYSLYANVVKTFINMLEPTWRMQASDAIKAAESRGNITRPSALARTKTKPFFSWSTGCRCDYFPFEVIDKIASQGGSCVIGNGRRLARSVSASECTFTFFAVFLVSNLLSLVGFMST